MCLSGLFILVANKDDSKQFEGAETEKDCNFAAPKVIRCLIPYHAIFAVITPIFAAPPKCRPLATSLIDWQAGNCVSKIFSFTSYRNCVRG